MAEFVGVENILHGRIVEIQDGFAKIAVADEIICALSDLPVGERVDVFIRPEAIVYSSSGPAGSARNVFDCRITKINSAGAMVRLEAECGFTLMGAITHQAAEELAPSLGGHIFASFKATAVHVTRGLG